MQANEKQALRRSGQELLRESKAYFSKKPREVNSLFGSAEGKCNLDATSSHS